MFEWAIAKNALTFEGVSKSINIQKDIIEGWFEGHSIPTFKELKKLAEALLIPYGYLFLSQPPKEEKVITDFRTLGSQVNKEYSNNLKEVILSTIRKQEWLKNHVIESGFNPLNYVGKFSSEDNPDEIANDIIKTLSIEVNLRKQYKNYEEFITAIIRACEYNGIVILRRKYVKDDIQRSLEIEEFRGFVISDEYAPFIFINANDIKAAQLFTLFHELAHIWINEDGVSELSVKGDSKFPSKIEQLCNAVAARVLVPDQILIELWDDKFDLEKNIKKIRLKCRVSNLVALRRLFDLGKVDKDTYEKEFKIRFFKYKSKEDENRKKRKERKKPGGPGLNWFYCQNSALFTNHVVSATLEGKLLYRDAARLFDKKNSNIINSLAKNLGYNS